MQQESLSELVTTKEKEIATDFGKDVEGVEEIIDYLELAKSKKVSQTDKVPPPETVIYLEHSEPNYRLFHKGSVSTVSGKAKAGKTTVIGLLIAPSLKKGLRILWIDTEQGSYYANSTQFYLLKLAGLHFCENLEMYDFREFSPVDRILLTKALLENYTYDIVIVDGVRDYIFDINNSTEATNILTEVMQWSVNYNCHVSILIHENKQGGELRGHLGTECENKSEIVITVALSTDQNPITIVKCKAVRGRPKFEDFFMRRDENGLPYIDTDISMIENKYIFSDEKPKKIKQYTARDYPIAFHNELLNQVFIRGEEQQSSQFKFNLEELWPIVWGNFYSGIENYFTKDKISDDFARSLKDYYKHSELTFEYKGSGNRTIVKQNAEYKTVLGVGDLISPNYTNQPPTGK